MKINISIDDVSPHPLSSARVLDRCHELIKVFPEIKFSLFVPTAYWRTVKHEISTPSPLFLHKFPEFCEVLRNLPSGNFEICYHGLFHGLPGVSDNDEFRDLDEEQSKDKFQQMMDVARVAGVEDLFKPIFRPPAWRMSPSSIIVAEKMGIKVLALSPKEYAKKYYAGAENKFSKVVYYNCNPPFDPLMSYHNTEVVYHACEWDKNYLSKNLAYELEEWLKLQKNFEFSFLEGLTS